MSYLILAALLLDHENERLYNPKWAAREAECAFDLERATPEGPAPGTYAIFARALLESGKSGAARDIIDEGLKRYPNDKALKALLERVKGGD